MKTVWGNSNIIKHLQPSFYIRGDTYLFLFLYENMLWALTRSILAKGKKKKKLAYLELCTTY